MIIFVENNNIVYHGSPNKFTKPLVSSDNNENTYPAFYVSKSKEYAIRRVKGTHPYYLYTYILKSGLNFFNIKNEKHRLRVINQANKYRPSLKRGDRLKIIFDRALLRTNYLSIDLEFYDVGRAIASANFDGLIVTEMNSINYGLYYPDESLTLINIEEVY